MASSKTSGNSKAKPASKPAKPAKPAPKPAAKAAKPATASKVVKPPTASKAAKSPTTARAAKADKPAATSKPSKALTRRVSRPSREERMASRHEKPGTGRVNRGASVDRVALSAGAAPERRSAPPAEVSGGRLSSPFSKDELAEWRRTLIEHRAEISQDITHLEQDAMEAEDGHTTPNHIAERGSDAEMQDMSLGLAGEEQIVLWQIDRALRKIDNGSPVPFGLCEHTKQPIPKTRLQLIPWTPVSIEGMNYVEENGLTLEDVLVDG